MRKFRWVSLSVCLLLCVCCAGLWAQGAPQVFVSTGAAGPIYSITAGVVSPLITNPGADFEGMVVAPYNFQTSQASSIDETTHYLVYVCDTANSKIWRFDPAPTAVGATPQSTLETIFDNSLGNPGQLTYPQCGRITSTGDLVVSSTVPGSGLWVFSDVTDLALGSPLGSRVPTQLVGVSGSSEGVAQKNTGDLLVVDNTNGKVLRTPLVPAATTTFISGLSQPYGIARRGDGVIFVATQANKPTLWQYTAQGANPTTCMTFKNNTPNFMQMALDNTLYVAVAGNTTGTVRSINANTCQQNQSYSIPQPAIGVALSPAMTAVQNVSASNGTAIVNFGFTAFELNQIVGPCGGTISVGLASPAAINALISYSNTPASTPAVNLGLDGFEAMFSTASLNGCAAGSAGSNTNNFQLSNLLSSGVVNPEIVVCSDPGANQTNCQSGSTNNQPPFLQQIGGWPIGGYLPNDLTGGGSKSLKCRIFMANAPPAQGQEAGIFCGFQSPLTNTSSLTTLNSWNLALAANITDGKSVPVKIKLASASGSCQNGPYITDATAILAVAQVLDSKGNSVFVPIGLISNGSSGLGQPLFKGDNNQQYLFNWDSSSCIMPSGVTQVCPKGTYSVTVLFLTNNTAGGLQSIYGAQTTLVNLK